MQETKKALVARLFIEHGTALRAFFARRVSAKDDAPDMVQEVYLRMLRVKDADALRNPEAYLFTVASHLVYEHAAKNRLLTTSDVHETASHATASAGADAADAFVLEESLDTDARVTRLREVLAQLPPKCRAVVFMKYQHGLRYEEIARHLDLSTHMVQKYLSTALAHCRRRMANWK